MGYTNTVAVDALKDFEVAARKFTDRPEQAPQGAPRGLSDDWTDEQWQTFFTAVRAACTCPRVGPNAPTVGFYRRPAIVIGHQPRCPALEVIWSRDREPQSAPLCTCRQCGAQYEDEQLCYGCADR